MAALPPCPIRGASFHGKERVCRLPASSFRAEARNLFRLRSGKRCEKRGHGKHRTPNDLEARCFMQDVCTQGKENGKRKRSLGCARDDETRAGLFPVFSSRLGSQPPPLRGTLPPSMGRRECAAFPHCHFERKREIFFVCGPVSNVRRGITRNTVLPTTWKHGVSCRCMYTGKRKRQTKKIPRLCSG